MTLHGEIESFNHNPGNILQYIERVGQYLFAYGTTDTKKKRAIFLILIEKKTHRIRRNLMLSEAPSAKCDEFLFGVLTEHLITTGRPT